MKPSDNVFDAMDEFWVEIADKNQTDFQLSFLKNHLDVDGRVLDLACGSGRHLIPLTKAGYDVVGFDVSLNLLRIAKQRLGEAVLVRGDMRFLPFKEGAFKAIISMDTSFGYLPSEEDDLSCLRDLSWMLKKSGVFIIDVFNRQQLISRYGHRGFLKSLKWFVLPALVKLRLRRVLFFVFKWREYSSFFLLQRRDLSSDNSKLCDLWVIFVKSSGRLIRFKHEVRLYGAKHILNMLSEAGFTMNYLIGGYEGQAFSDDANRLIISSEVRG